MATMDEFESLLKEVVTAKRLSASKTTKLTDMAMNLLHGDTQLVTTLFRTHKSLPSTAKVSSLYIFDSLSRKARSLARRDGSGSEKNNAISFLAKIEGVLDGLFRDMTSVETPEAKEKTQKILDLWVKGNTFPASVLSRLAEIMKQTSEVEREPSNDASLPPSTTPPGSPPTKRFTLDQRTQPEAPSSTPDAQATLLALLTKAAQVNLPNSLPSTQIPSQLDAILRQVPNAQAALLGTAIDAPHGSSPFVPLATSNVPSNPQPQPTTATQDPRQRRSPNGTEIKPTDGPGTRDYQRHSPKEDHNYPYDERRPDHRGTNDRDYQREPYHQTRGGFRGRGRGFGRPDRTGDWKQTADWRRQRSRSRSPEHRQLTDSPTTGRAQNFTLSSGARNIVSYPEQGLSTLNTVSDAGNTIPEKRSAESAVSGPTASHSPAPSSVPITAPSFVAPPSSLPDATESKQLSLPVQSAPSTSQITPAAQQGLESFDITTFNFTDPSAWEMLGKMWEITNGRLPSQEELMHFMAMSSTSLQQPMQGSQSEDWVDGGDGTWQNGAYSQYHGGNNRHHKNDNTDAVVLGEAHNTQTASGPRLNGNTGGRMQRVGEKWVFVRGA